MLAGGIVDTKYLSKMCVNWGRIGFFPSYNVDTTVSLPRILYEVVNSSPTR